MEDVGTHSESADGEHVHAGNLFQIFEARQPGL